MKQIFYTIGLISLFFPLFLLKTPVVAESNNSVVVGYPTPTIKLEVKEKIPALTEELKLESGKKVECSTVQFHHLISCCH